LQNSVRAAVYQTAGRTIIPADLPGFGEPAHAHTPAAGGPPAFDMAGAIEAILADGGGDVYGRVVALVERELFTRTLRHTHGHQAQASELLGINRTTLRHKLRDLGIAVDRVVSDRADGGDG
jgi:two-component system nitrogen regulation response regulator GlnG